MRRIDTATKHTDKFGAGKHGFRNGDLPNAIIPTDLVAEWFDHVQEEIAAVPEAAGIALDNADRSQLLAAIRRITGKFVTTFTNGTHALTAAHAGLVLVNAAGGNVTLNLPAASTVAGLEYRFLRTDTSGNTVTINRAGADTIDGATSISLAVQKSGVVIEADGTSQWRAALNFEASLGSSGWQRLPSGLIVQWGAGTTNGSGVATVTMPVTYPVGVQATSVTHHATGAGSDTIVSAYSIGASSFGVSSVAPGGAVRGTTAFCWVSTGR